MEYGLGYKCLAYRIERAYERRRRSCRAIAYKFRAFLPKNECLGNFENLSNGKVT